MLGTGLGAGDTAENKLNRNLDVHEAHILHGWGMEGNEEESQ